MCTAGVTAPAPRIVAHTQESHAGADHVVRCRHRRRAADSGHHGTSHGGISNQITSVF